MTRVVDFHCHVVPVDCLDMERTHSGATYGLRVDGDGADRCVYLDGHLALGPGVAGQRWMSGNGVTRLWDINLRLTDMDTMGVDVQVIAVPPFMYYYGIPAGDAHGFAAFFLDGHLRAGMTPSSAVWWLPGLAGYQAAMSIMLTGRKVSAHEALQRGFVTAIVPPDELDAAVDQTCAQICRSDRDVLIRTKRAVRHALETDFAHSTEQVGYLRSLPRSTQ
jgi:hypothetical protein